MWYIIGFLLGGILTINLAEHINLSKKTKEIGILVLGSAVGVIVSYLLW